MSTALEERTVAGLHDFLMERVLPRWMRPGLKMVDLGAGSGVFAQRLQARRLDVLAVDTRAAGARAPVPFVAVDLNDVDFASALGRGQFDLVVAIEVIEHLENPVGFLRNVAALLSRDGVAIVTTPNVENVAARLRFLLQGRIRMMDARGDPTHISPIFCDLLERQLLPRAGLRMEAHHVYPPKSLLASRASWVWVLRLIARLLQGPALLGDSHVLVLRRQGE